MQVYLLTVRAGGLKLVEDSVVRARGFLGKEFSTGSSPFISLWKEDDKTCCEGGGTEAFYG